MKTTKSVLIFFFCTSFLTLLTCSDYSLKYEITHTLNPYRIAPLAALANITVNKPCKVSVEVLGESPIKASYDIDSKNFEVPIVGLYPDTNNKVVFNIVHDTGKVTDTINVLTGKLPVSFPRIEINKLDRNNMEDGFHLCDLHFAQNGKYHSSPMIFDDQGKVRWYLDLSFFDNILYPINLLKDGNFVVGGKNSIFEFNLLGKRVKEITLDPKYKVHHEILELPEEKLLVAVGKNDVTIEVNGEKMVSKMDHIMLFDRNSSKIIKEWDLAKHLDVSRKGVNPLSKQDWAHVNGLAFKEKDSSIYITSKQQGLIKISWDDKLQWIMSPKKDWGKAGRKGNGHETEPFLLTAIDEQGNSYPKHVQSGDESPEKFDFPWGLHAPLILPNDNILVFDNGALRNYNFENNYSRAVEYFVNEEEMTVKQIWQYGKERGDKTFSLLISDVDYLPNTTNILVTFGFINHNAKIVEVNYPNHNEVFEATLYFKTLNGKKIYAWGQLDILYRSERIDLTKLLNQSEH